MSKHFCCCIPVRAAVFFFSLISLVVFGALAGFAWYVVHLILSGQVVNGVDFSSINRTGRIAFIVSGSVFTIIALIDLFGFVGSILRKRRFVKAFSYLTWVIFFLFLAVSGFFFYAIFSGRNLFPNCQFKDPNSGDVRECTFNLPLWQKIVSTIVIIVELFFQLYFAVVIRRYVDQLEDEHDYKHEYKLAKHSQQPSTYTPSYYPPTAQDSHQGLLHTGGNYPYTDAAHSFGNRA